MLGKRSLDYLWFGIGAYLAKHPEYLPIWPSVYQQSTAQQRQRNARALLLAGICACAADGGFHVAALWFIQIPKAKLDDLYFSEDYQSNFKQLKQVLASMGADLPLQTIW